MSSSGLGVIPQVYFIRSKILSQRQALQGSNGWVYCKSGGGRQQNHGYIVLDCNQSLGTKCVVKPSVDPFVKILPATQSRSPLSGFSVWSSKFWVQEREKFWEDSMGIHLRNVDCMKNYRNNGFPSYLLHTMKHEATSIGKPSRRHSPKEPRSKHMS